jgi:hypothetical protein
VFDAKAVQAACPPPRGLLWQSLSATGPAMLGRRGWWRFAAVPAQFLFEPIPDGPLAENPLAREPRLGVVLLHRRPWGRCWQPWRIVFNLSAEAVMGQFR